MDKKKSDNNISDSIVCVLIGLFVVFILGLLFTKFFKYSEVFIIGSYSIQVVIITIAILISNRYRKRNKIELITGEEISDNEKTVMYEWAYGDDKDSWNDAKENANKALSQFIWAWIFIWVFWLLLYMAHLFNPVNNSIISFFLNPLSNANTLMLLICYLILYEVTTPDDQIGITGSPNWAPWVSLFLFITFLEFMITHFFKDSSTATDIEQIFNWVSGITSGAVMALFVGRFDKVFIKTKLKFLRYLLFLYLYMAIQAIYPLFNKAEAPSEYLSEFMQDNYFQIKLGISVTTMVCKIILFLFVYELIKSGRLLFYFIKIRKLHHDVKDQWKEFNEEHKFTRYRDYHLSGISNGKKVSGTVKCIKIHYFDDSS